ncbi:hypothetical protein CVT26_010068 [Gymnopilus dilepis]|uniref:Nephrocystin 3-like N-terminal domain-containing protein n=1 Tax=Gymnopilus dilepis TaxID=231916 RepID=A0A409VWK3_9AGAR|nr:hypothetical protein CVT26_010068 [Gymnopilus dilepis]
MASKAKHRDHSDKIKSLLPLPSHRLFRVSNSLSPTNGVPTEVDSAPPAPLSSSREAFQKTEDFRRDIARLHTAYVLRESPEDLKKLIERILHIHHGDDKHKLTDVLETCIGFCVELIACGDLNSADSMAAVNEFHMLLDQIDPWSLDDADVTQLTTGVVRRQIDKIKSNYKLCDKARSTKALTLAKVIDIALGPSIAVLSLIEHATSLAPVPWLQPVIGQVVNLLQAVSQTRSNYNGMMRIAATAGEFVASLAVISSAPQHTEEVQGKLEISMHQFSEALEEIANDCHKLSKRSTLSRMIQQTALMDELQALRERLTTAIQLFQNETLVHIKLDADSFNTKFDFALLDNLPCHPDYGHNEYLQGTRDDIIDDVYDWLDEQTRDTVLWMYGAAGVGKSTLSKKLVELLRSDDRLAGGVFLRHLRTEPAGKVVQMISRQLGRMHPQTLGDIAQAARKLDNLHHTLGDYLSAYLVDPIRNLPDCQRKLAIVIDGLDEWTESKYFLQEISRISKPIPFKLILTSRSTQFIETLVESEGVSFRARGVPSVSDEVVKHYFRHHFQSDGINWRGHDPDEEKIGRLAVYSGGLLIWAAQARSLLLNKFSSRYPHETLEEILSSGGKIIGGQDRQLDRLYRDALANLVARDIRGTLHNFLEATMVLQEPLPMHDFAFLLDIPLPLVEVIHERLGVLQRQGDLGSGTISPAEHRFHASFLEFLQSADTEPDFRVNIPEAHSNMAKKCIQFIDRGLSAIVKKNFSEGSNPDLSPFRRYAIKFWLMHITKGPQRGVEDAASISALDLHDWATLFLPLVSPKSQGRYNSLNGASSPSELLHKVAVIIGNQDSSTLAYHIQCLELSAQLQPSNTETWKALAEALRDEGRSDASMTSSMITSEEPQEGKASSPVRPVANDGLRRMLLELGKSLQKRFEQHGISTDLDESIAFHKQALEVCPPQHSAYAHTLAKLGAVLKARYAHQSNPSDLDDAISSFQEVVKVRTSTDPCRASSLNDLATVLESRYRKKGQAKDIEDSISLYREALRLRPSASDAVHRRSLHNLALALEARGTKRGSASDLDESVKLNRHVLEMRQIGDPSRHLSLCNLAYALQSRFKVVRDGGDLDQAITLFKEALNLRKGPTSDRIDMLDGLALALDARYTLRGGKVDMDEAIELRRERLKVRQERDSR